MTNDEKDLFEKIVRAKVVLEGAMRPHSMTCPADDGCGTCMCGASAANIKLSSALTELK